MKRFFILFFLLFLPPSGNSDNLPPFIRILLKTSPSITINGKSLEIIDPFSFLPIASFISGRLKLTFDESGILINQKPTLKTYIIVKDKKNNLEVDGRIYPGKMEIILKEGLLYLINDIDLETYITGVVASEMPSQWPVEALKAQAVAARTYAYNLLRKNRNSIYDLTSTYIHQVYNGIHTASPDVLLAVESTKGEVLTYRGELIEPYYHSHCSGQTESSFYVWGRNIPYLQSVRCFHSDRKKWEFSISRKKLGYKIGFLDIKEVKILKRSPSGRVSKISLSDGKERKIISGEDLRRAIGYNEIKSTLFEVKEAGDYIIFKGEGMGHGVGMCQWGAYEMAKRGYNYRHILFHYYRGVDILKIY